MRVSLFATLFLLIPQFSFSQTTTVVILNEAEVSNLKLWLGKDPKARILADSILNLAELALKEDPKPLKVVHYEGLLEIDPKRIHTKKSFADIDNVVNLIYASYCTSDRKIPKKIKTIVTSWSSTYQPTGNTINENKFIPFFWGYYLFQDEFNKKEQQKMENWMREIATKQMQRKRTPNNNWEAKRQKLIGIAGCILEDRKMIDFSINGFEKYINTSYFEDGTSRDLKQRDAMHYHFSGLKPTLSVFVNLSKFDDAFNLFDYVGEDGGSIKKSVEYGLPYATGEKQRAEWVNTKVELDKKRAAAGLPEYQPGVLFDPKDAIPTFQWACYYNAAWYEVLGKKDDYSSTWVGLLNSPVVRKIN